MNTYTVDDEHYVFICSVHDDIEKFAKDVEALAQKIIRLEKVAKEMGQNMESGLYAKRESLDETYFEIRQLKKKLEAEKKKVAAAKATIKRLRESKKNVKKSPSSK